MRFYFILVLLDRGLRNKASVDLCVQGMGGWFQTSSFVLIKLCVGNVLDHVMIFMCSAFW